MFHAEGVFNNVCFAAPCDGILKNLYAFSVGDLSIDLTLTVYVNGVSTNLGVSLSTAGGATSNTTVLFR